MTFGYLKRAEFTKALGELLHNRVYHCSTEDIFGPTVYHNYICAGGGGGGGGEKSLGGPGLFFFREKGWAKREFHDHWGWVIVCFVKNLTYYNSCGRSK